MVFPPDSLHPHDTEASALWLNTIMKSTYPPFCNVWAIIEKSQEGVNNGRGRKDDPVLNFYENVSLTKE